MKALTVQQPWAWAIIHGGKFVENRTQLWTYRGPLAIHAGARISDRGMTSPLIRAAWTGPTKTARNPSNFPRWIEVPDRSTLVLGAIIGVVDLVDAHLDGGCCRPWGESAYVEHGGRARRAIVHLRMEGARPLQVPVPCRGALGLWTPPADLVAELVA